MRMGKKTQGFTIVELLIVIVVIGILAAITIVAYNGVQNRARTSALQTTLAQLAKKVEASRATDASNLYPANLAATNTNAPSNYVYSVNTTNTGYCIVGVDGDQSFYVTNAVPTPQAGSCVTVNGLLAWWPLNGSPADVSGNNIATTPVNVTATTGQNGQVNGAYSFNGTTSQLQCGMPTLLQVTSAVTVSAWINLAALLNGGMSGIVNYGGGGYWLTVDGGSGYPSLYISSTTLPGASALGLNQWYYLTGTYSSGDRRLYVNGSMVSSDTASGVTSIGGYANYCEIGSVKSVNGRFMNGKIDDVRIYNRVLSAAEIQALYAAGAQ